MVGNILLRGRILLLLLMTAMFSMTLAMLHAHTMALA